MPSPKQPAQNPIPAIPPCVVRTPHLHGPPTTEENQLNSDTNVSNKTYLKEIQEKRKEETFSSGKNEKRKCKIKRYKRFFFFLKKIFGQEKRKEEVRSETAQKNDFFKRNVTRNLEAIEAKNRISSKPRKRKKKKEEKEKKNEET